MVDTDLTDFGLNDEDIFSSAQIFKNRELIQADHVPPLDKVVGRNEVIKEVGRALGPATRGGPPSNMILYGKTGTGKSLVSRSVTRRASQLAEENGASMQHTYVDCSEISTETQVSVQMAESLRLSLGLSTSEVNIPQTGLAASQYRDKVWRMLNENGVDAYVIILDEIDKLSSEHSNNILRTLSRARESGKTDTHVGIICVSNKIDYRDNVEKRVDSSLRDREFVFSPYDAAQIRNILKSREDAFYDDVLEQGVIPKTAALAAQEHGDARKAVDMLYYAGYLAESEDAEKVTEEHVMRAEEEAEVNRFQKLISGQTTQVKYVLRALAMLTEQENKKAFKTSRIFDVYTSIAESRGSTTLSYHRTHELLKEQAFLNVTEYEHTGSGRGEGSYDQHRLLHDPDMVIEALNKE